MQGVGGKWVSLLVCLPACLLRCVCVEGYDSTSLWDGEEVVRDVRMYVVRVVTLPVYV